MSQSVEIYQKLKSQLISLNLDYEDKSNLINILENKCNQKRESLSNVEDEIDSSYQQIIQVIIKKSLLQVLTSVYLIYYTLYTYILLLE